MPGISAEELARIPLERGLGYSRASVKRWRKLALEAIADLEASLARSRQELESKPIIFDAPSPEQIAATLTPDELRQVGLIAIGLALVDGIESAERRKQEACALVNQVLNDALTRLRSADQALASAGHAATDDARRALRQAAAALRGPASPPPQQGSRQPHTFAPPPEPPAP